MLLKIRKAKENYLSFTIDGKKYGVTEYEIVRNNFLYYSNSKGKQYNMSEMNTIHLINALKKIIREEGSSVKTAVMRAELKYRNKFLGDSEAVNN